MLEYMRRGRDWVYDHGFTVLVFLLGITAGIILRLPGFDFHITDTNSQIIGAGLGAGIAVAGAIWATNASERKRKNALKVVVVVITDPFVEFVGNRLGQLQHLSGTVDVIKPADLEHLSVIDSEATRCVARLDGIRPAFQSDAVDLLVFGHLKDAFKAIGLAATSAIEANDQRMAYYATERQRHVNANLPIRPCPPADFGAVKDRVMGLIKVVSTVGG